MMRYFRIMEILCNLIRNLVINGANKEKDLIHMEKVRQMIFSKSDITIEHRTEDALIALQGPKSAQILQKYLKTDLNSIYFNNFVKETIPQFKAEFIFYRTGYTGEDGFEISMPNSVAVDFVDSLFATGEVHPAGLGARDALRLEAGMLKRPLPSWP
jgi:aminomethyltransferase